MKKLEQSVSLLIYETEQELNAEDRELLEYARQAAQKAYSPYSRFQVGAALRLRSGRIITGNNQENMAYPSGLCAERVAIFAASSNHPDDPVMSIAISAFSDLFEIHDPVTPCGACRQVMFETEMHHHQPIRIIMPGENGKILISEGTENLLPFHFHIPALITRHPDSGHK